MFNKNFIPWIIAGVFLIWAIIASTCSGDEPDYSLSKERELQYKRQHAIDSVDKVKSDSTIASLEKTIIDTVKAVIVKAEAKDKEIRVLRTKLAKSRPQVQPLLDSIPVLKSFVDTQDSVIHKQDEQIKDLQGGLYQISKELNALIGERETNTRIAAEMLQKCEMQINVVTLERDDARKQLRKERRKKRLSTILIPVVAVGAFLAGTSF